MRLAFSRLAVVLALLAAPAVRAEEGNDILWRPYDGFLPGQAWGHRAVLLVRDIRTGRPIEGARVRRCPEGAIDPVFGWGVPREQTTTDAYGLAWIAFDDAPPVAVVDPDTGETHYVEAAPQTSHWAVDAPGYAPTETYGGRVGEVIELVPGVDRHGRIVDAFGRPAVGVEVEFKVGCAHAPALRTAVTDDEGRFLLTCIGRAGDLCYDGRGVRAAYGSVEDLGPPELAAATYHARPAGTIVGRIEGPTRDWLARALVQSTTSSRGPMARVAPDGTFRLEGADLEASLKLIHPDSPRWEEAILDPWDHRPGGPFTWHHPSDAGEETTAEVIVEATHAGEAWSPGGSDLFAFLDRESDGRRFYSPFDERGQASFDVTPGTYDLFVGEPFDAYTAAPQSLEIGSEGDVFEVPLQAQPRLEITGWSTLPEEAIVELVLPARELRLSSSGEPAAVHLPVDVAASLVVRAGGGAGFTRAFPVGLTHGGVRRSRIDWPSPTIIEVRGLQHDDDTARGDLPVVDARLVPWTHAWPENVEGGFRISTYQQGRVALVLESHVLGACRAVLDLPSPTGGHLVVEPPAFDPGRPGVLHVEGTDAWEDRLPRCRVYVEDALDEVWPGEDGAYRSPSLRDGAHVRIAGRHEVLEGQGPYRIVLGRGSILLRVHAEGVGREPVVYLDGRMWRPESRGPSGGGPWDLRMPALDAGRHQLIVARDGHHTRRAVVDLDAEEERRLAVHLPRREVDASAAVAGWAVPELVALLDDPGPPRRAWAATALAHHPATDDRALGPLVARAADDDSDVRRAASQALLDLAEAGRLSAAPGGQPAADASPSLVGDALVGTLDEPATRRVGLRLLRFFPPHVTPGLLQRVTALLGEELEEATRVAAVELLGSFGPPAEAAIPHLERILSNSESWPLLDATERALARIRDR